MGRFYLWLMDQLHRRDLVGTLARSALHDTNWPASGTFSDHCAHLNARHAHRAAHRGLKAAWCEWQVHVLLAGRSTGS
jgi:hypothetical protein